MGRIARSASKIAASAALMGLAVSVVLRWTTAATSSATLAGRAIEVGLPLIVGVAVFLALCRMFRVSELDEFLAALKKPAPKAT